VRDGDAADDEDWLGGGKLGDETEAAKARRGVQRIREAGQRRETSFIMWRREWTLSGAEMARESRIYSAA